mmetsp:Transcript_101113/g.309213  ORF Transcript_101113/g.309213 Transcript_101113/m.309213 type:complete len:202 (+) Transcript_101113:718-1323(+)
MGLVRQSYCLEAPHLGVQHLPVPAHQTARELAPCEGFENNALRHAWVEPLQPRALEKDCVHEHHDHIRVQTLEKFTDAAVCALLHPCIYRRGVGAAQFEDLGAVAPFGDLHIVRHDVSEDPGRRRGVHCFELGYWRRVAQDVQQLPLTLRTLRGSACHQIETGLQRQRGDCNIAVRRCAVQEAEQGEAEGVRRGGPGRRHR